MNLNVNLANLNGKRCTWICKQEGLGGCSRRGCCCSGCCRSSLSTPSLLWQWVRIFFPRCKYPNASSQTTSGSWYYLARYKLIGQLAISKQVHAHSGLMGALVCLALSIFSKTQVAKTQIDFAFGQSPNVKQHLQAKSWEFPKFKTPVCPQLAPQLTPNIRPKNIFFLLD